MDGALKGEELFFVLLRENNSSEAKNTGRIFCDEDPAKDGINWYVYCGNNPLARMDSDGKLDMYFAISGEFAVGETGSTGAVGIVLDISGDDKSVDIFYNHGIAAGYSAGFGFAVGCAFRDIEGLTPLQFDFNGFFFSGSLFTDDKGVNGFQLSWGPEAGVSMSSSEKHNTGILQSFIDWLVDPLLEGTLYEESVKDDVSQNSCINDFSDEYTVLDAQGNVVGL